MSESTTARAPATMWLSIVVTTALTVIIVQVQSRYLYGAFVHGPSASQSLRILTWNIGKVFLPWESRAADRDLDHVARVIDEVQPHVVALQELRDRRQLGRLLGRLGPAWRGRLPEDQYDRRAALLLRLDKRATFVDLRTSTGRIAQGATVTIGRGERIALSSIHLDAFDPDRRRAQAEEIVAAIARLDVDALVLAGDFNFDPAHAARGSGDRNLYGLLTRDLTDAGADAGSTTLISRRLDYVFFRSARVTRSEARVLRQRRINLMDHDPLVVELFF